MIFVCVENNLWLVIYYTGRCHSYVSQVYLCAVSVCLLMWPPVSTDNFHVNFLVLLTRL